MTRKAFLVMAVLLVAATAATVATAFAGTGKHKRNPIYLEVARAIDQNSLQMLRLRIKALQIGKAQRLPPPTTGTGIGQ